MHTLPINAVLDELHQALSTHHEVILEAPPGAGKTTLVPLSLLEQPWLCDQKILVLEPRRLAAKAAAERMASLLGEPVGKTIGYRIRLDTRVSLDTRIEIVTEGVLTRLLQQDPSLEGYGLIIFDEFHERSLDADLGLTLSLEARSLFRDEHNLKLLIMSATLDDKGLLTLLPEAPVVRSLGRSFPVQTIYCGASTPGEWIEPRMVNAVQQAIAEQQGSILCFLPGVKEIRQTEQLLQESLQQDIRSGLIIAPLYGDLSLEQQQRAIKPAPDGQRKVVLATSIAETSLTIEGIEVVIDSGLNREARYDPRTALSRLHTTRVTRAAAIQRAGRAGRLSPGVCYRLWSEGQDAQLNAFRQPEILQADLTQLALQLYAWGIDEPTALQWLTPPPPGAFQQALDLLQQLGALTPELRVTAHGEAMATLPAHPRISHMLIKAAELNLQTKACQLAALMMERDPLQQSSLQQDSSDINLRLDWLNTPSERRRGVWQRIQKQAKHYLRLCERLPKSGSDSTVIADAEQAGLLLALAYPDRIGQARASSQSLYRLNNGRAAQIRPTDSMHKQTWLVAAQLTGKTEQKNDLITLAAPLNPALIESHLPELLHTEEIIQWDDDRLLAEVQYKIGSLIYQRRKLESPSQDSLSQAIVQHIRKTGLQLLPWSDDLRNLQQRVVFIAQHDSCHEWPDLSDAWLSAHLEQWLQPYLDQVSHIRHLKQLDLRTILLGLLPWPLPQKLDQLAPETFQVPSGSRIRIDYSGNPPILAVKLQEMFGTVETPCIAHNVALQLHLLSPAQRPLQVTQDLASFWKNGYPEVQKDMKGRYPKHPWPDDPLQAQATAKTKRHFNS